MERERKRDGEREGERDREGKKEVSPHMHVQTFLVKTQQSQNLY